MRIKAHAWIALTTLLSAMAATNLRADVITFKQNAPNPFGPGTYTGMEDNWIHLNGPGSTEYRNAGGDGRIIMGATAADGLHNRHAFLRWDLSSMAGQAASIESVTLRLYWHVTPSGSDTIQIFPVSAANAGWVEGSGGTLIDGVPPESTWSYKNLYGTPWAGSEGASTPGVDYVNTVLASNTYNGTEVAGTYLEFTFNDPSIINSWMSGGPNPGLFMKTVGEDEQAQFRSSEYTGFEPELTVNFTPAAVPEPSSFLLLGVVASVAGFARGRRRLARAAE